MTISDNNQTYHLTLVRHGESVGNANGYHQGQAEFRLTEKGREQACALAKYWSETGETFDAAVASPQIRAKETAEIITVSLGLKIEFDPIWMERDNGILAGLTLEESRKRYPPPDFQSLYNRIGQTGESEWELFLRGGRAIQSMLHRPPGKYLVVSHGAILNMTLRALLGITPQANFQGGRFRFRNTAFVSLLYTPKKHEWIVEGVNQRPHWTEKPE